MTEDIQITISKDELFRPEVDEAMEHQAAILRHFASEPTPEVSLIRKILLSALFYMPFFAVLGSIVAWMIMEPYFDDFSLRTNESLASGEIWFIPVIAALITVFIFMGDSFIRRIVFQGARQAATRGVIVLILVFVAQFPIAFLTFGRDKLLDDMLRNQFIWSMKDVPTDAMILFTVWRTTAISLIGMSIGLGMYLGAGTKKQLESAVLGGAIGGALGGLIFEIFERFILYDRQDAEIERLVTSIVIGFCVGLFIALSNQLSRVGWFRVHTGPLAGKAFVIHNQTTSIGSSPQANIYLFKDAEIDPRNAVVHKIGSHHVIEDMDSRHGTFVNGIRVRRRRLQSGDQVVVGSTILEFEERAKHRHKLREDNNNV